MQSVRATEVKSVVPQIHLSMRGRAVPHRGGYFFLVMLITPKITTANKLSNCITSTIDKPSPPLRGNNLAAQY